MQYEALADKEKFKQQKETIKLQNEIKKEELDYLVAQSGGSARVHYLVGSRREYAMDAKSLQALVPRIADSDIYICGPEPLVDAVRKAADDLGVPKNRFHNESFSFS